MTQVELKEKLRIVTGLRLYSSHDGRSVRKLEAGELKPDRDNLIALMTGVHEIDDISAIDRILREYELSPLTSLEIGEYLLGDHWKALMNARVPAELDGAYMTISIDFWTPDGKPMLNVTGWRKTLRAYSDDCNGRKG